MKMIWIMPHPPDQGDNAARGRNRKRRHNQARGQSPNPTATPPGGAVGSGEEEEAKKRHVSIRCSPVKFKELVAALNKSMKAQVREKNFGGLLFLQPSSLDMQLLSWLMRKLNPETMKLEIGGGKEIAIT